MAHFEFWSVEQLKKTLADPYIAAAKKKAIETELAWREHTAVKEAPKPANDNQPMKKPRKAPLQVQKLGG